MLRKFSPAFLNSLDFVQDAEGEETGCVRALRTLKELNATGRRKLPGDARTDFVPQRLRPIVDSGDDIDRRAWECALLLKLRDELKAGNLSVRYSKRFARLDDFFIDDRRWQGMRQDFFRRSGLFSDPALVPEYLANRLGNTYEAFLKTAPTNTYAVVDEDGWHLSAEPTEKLDQEAQDRLARLKSWLAKNMRHVKLPELLIEVDNELRFTRHFLTAAQRQEPSPEDICAVLAAVMAHGCNLGPYTMAQLTPDVTYEQLKRIGDWQLTEEAQRSALAELVGAIAGLDTSSRWGEGRTAASDGQRFSLPRRVLQQTYSTRFSDFALEFYTFVADNYAPFYSLPIECTDRDAAFVLDGLLYNESELDIEEHYTDTHGYTELNFAAFAMVGLRFCPRIRGVQHQRIYRIDPNRDYGALAALVARADRTIDTELIAEQWDRMGQLYASLKTGHVTASVALKRLVAFSAKNRFYRATRDLGRILKTEFILQYLVRTGAAWTNPARAAQGRATARLGAGRLLRSAGPNQRPRVVGANEHLQLPDPDPGLHRLLAGAGNLPGLKPVRPGRQRGGFVLARTCQPHRMGQRGPVRTVHPRSEARPYCAVGASSVESAIRLNRISPPWEPVTLPIEMFDTGTVMLGTLGEER
jgi:TnpA family transposase